MGQFPMIFGFLLLCNGPVAEAERDLGVILENCFNNSHS